MQPFWERQCWGSGAGVPHRGLLLRDNRGLSRGFSFCGETGGSAGAGLVAREGALWVMLEGEAGSSRGALSLEAGLP